MGPIYLLGPPDWKRKEESQMGVKVEAREVRKRESQRALSMGTMQFSLMSFGDGGNASQSREYGWTLESGNSPQFIVCKDTSTSVHICRELNSATTFMSKEFVHRTSKCEHILAGKLLWPCELGQKDRPSHSIPALLMHRTVG